MEVYDVQCIQHVKQAAEVASLFSMQHDRVAIARSFLQLCPIVYARQIKQNFKYGRFASEHESMYLREIKDASVKSTSSGSKMETSETYFEERISN